MSSVYLKVFSFHSVVCVSTRKALSVLVVLIAVGMLLVPFLYFAVLSVHSVFGVFSVPAVVEMFLVLLWYLRCS